MKTMVKVVMLFAAAFVLLSATAGAQRVRVFVGTRGYGYGPWFRAYYPPIYPVYPYYGPYGYPAPFSARPGYGYGARNNRPTGSTGSIKFDLDAIPKYEREMVESACVTFPDKNGKRPCYGSVKSFDHKPLRLPSGTYDMTIILPNQREIYMPIEVRSGYLATIPLNMGQARPVIEPTMRPPYSANGNSAPKSPVEQ